MTPAPEALLTEGHNSVATGEPTADDDDRSIVVSCRDRLHRR